MDDSTVLRGTELRYALTMYLAQHGPCDIATLIAGLADQGFVVGGYPPKSVSDALRWERGHFRVMRRGRGTYDYWEMPRSTEYRIHKRVLALPGAGRPNSLRGGQIEWCSRPGLEGSSPGPQRRRHRSTAAAKSSV